MEQRQETAVVTEGFLASGTQQQDRQFNTAVTVTQPVGDEDISLPHTIHKHKSQLDCKHKYEAQKYQASKREMKRISS